MMTIHADFAVPLLYSLCGFFMAFFLSRALNIAVFTAFIYVVFKLLDGMKENVDWTGFWKLPRLLMEAGTVLVSICTGIIHSASTSALLFFVIGGFCGLVMACLRR